MPVLTRRLALTASLGLLTLLGTACSGNEDLSSYSDCPFFEGRYIAHDAKCIDESGDLIKIEDSGVDFAGYVQGQ